MGRWVDGWGPELSGFKVGFAKIRERDPYGILLAKNLTQPLKSNQYLI